MKSLIVMFLTAAAFSLATGQDMRNNAARSLFSDQKAGRVGDAVMILVVEESSASNAAKTTTSRQSDLSLSASGKTGSSNLPDVGLGIGTGNSFKGEGGTSTNGSVRAKLSARIDSVFPNGNLWINGTRTIVVNGEEQTIRITGVVRPSDIAYDNSVLSYNIAEARISFEGNGIVSRAQGPGWITKLLHWLF
ncbi:MAG: flagellar basal body L-ring protein FlgH [Bacteroidota bacterium]